MKVDADASNAMQMPCGTMSTASVGSYLFPIFTTSCQQLFPLLPLHGVWRRCVVGVDIQLLRVGQRWCLEELRWSVGQEEGEGGHWSVRRPQVINVQAVPVTSLLITCQEAGFQKTGKSLDITEMLLHHSLAKHSGSHPVCKHTSCQGMHVF